MDRRLFASLLAKHLYPHLRAQGFRGSGTTLRRLDLPMVNVFNVQASSGATRCYLNLGVHLTFLPPEGGQLVEPQELGEAQCAFRSRIDPPGDQLGWYYGSSESEAEAQVRRIVGEWERQAEPFFAEHSYPQGVARLLEGALASNARPKHLLTLARIAENLGSREQAELLGRAALERVSPSASGLKYEITQFLESARAT